MYGIGAGVEGCVDNLLDIEISVAECAVAEWTSFVCETAVERVGIVVGIDSYRVDTQLLKRPNHSHRDLAAACYQHFMNLLRRHSI